MHLQDVERITHLHEAEEVAEAKLHIDVDVHTVALVIYFVTNVVPFFSTPTGQSLYILTDSECLMRRAVNT